MDLDRLCCDALLLSKHTVYINSLYISFGAVYDVHERNSKSLLVNGRKIPSNSTLYIHHDQDGNARNPSQHTDSAGGMQMMHISICKLHMHTIRDYGTLA